jgi:hypothetical protein
MGAAQWYCETVCEPMERRNSSSVTDGSHDRDHGNDGSHSHPGRDDGNDGNDESVTPIHRRDTHPRHDRDGESGDARDGNGKSELECERERGKQSAEEGKEMRC